MQELELLSVVALLPDNVAHGLVRGQVGTVVERLDEGVVEVEFSDDNGHTFELLPVPVDQLLPLHHQQESSAA
jgi:hypothetical protein